jgi:diguanylate cyclase (GGDEF)-like protein/PAS domain S-box-containing protein
MLRHPPNELLLAAILESTEDALFSVALDGTIQTWSPSAERLYGYTPAEMIGRPLMSLLPLYEAPALETLLSEVSHGEIRCSENAERLHKNGSIIWVTVKYALIRDEHGEIIGVLERAQPFWNWGNAATETQLRLLVEQMPVVLWTTDQTLRITSNWGSGLRLSKIRPENLIGRTVFEYLNCKDPQATPIKQHYDALRGASSRFEYRRRNCVFDIHLEPLRSACGEIIGCIGVGLDITERKKTEEQIRYQATHDALTGLANYRDFFNSLEQEVRRVERSRHSFALLLLDLDDLKEINDRLGHPAGNRALKRLAQVMQEHCRSIDVAARYGGDEFAVILIDSDLGMAEHVAERIEACLRNDPEEPPLRVSIGIGVYPEDGRTAQDLLEAADRRLYRRKRSSRHRIATAI